MQSGNFTVGDSMRRHLITLEREQENLRSAAVLCADLTNCSEKLDALDAQVLLTQMEQMEQEGTTFMDKQKLDTKRQYIAPVIAAIVMTILMTGLIWLFLWAFKTDPLGAPPLPLLALFIIIPVLVILGVVIAMVQRLRELGKNEAADAKHY